MAKKVKEKKVVTEVVKEVKKEEVPEGFSALTLSAYKALVTELRSADSLTHEQIEQLLTKYGI